MSGRKIISIVNSGVVVKIDRDRPGPIGLLASTRICLRNDSCLNAVASALLSATNKTASVAQPAIVGGGRLATHGSGLTFEEGRVLDVA